MFSSNTSQVSSGGYEIQRSLRFNSADSAYLNRTPASAGNRRTWTWSAWVKRGSLTSASGFAFFNQGGVSSNYTLARFTVSDNLDFQSYGTSAFNFQKISTAVYRDPSAWYHIVFVLDATNTQARIYVNGAEVAYSTNVNPANADQPFNQAALNRIGYTTDNVLPFDGYMTEVNFIDGQALTPSSFGAFDAQTGVWGPTRYAGSYGTNGFYLNFSDNSNTTAATLGRDYSGNSNNWTPNNFSVSAGAGNDSLVDVPTNWGVDAGVGGTVRGNYATLNPLDKSTNASAVNGNLDVTSTGGTWVGIRATLGMQTGKWYCEYTPTSGIFHIVSVSQPQASTASYIIDSPLAYGYQWDGNKVTNGAPSSYASGWGVGDIIGIVFDADAGTITFYKNNVSQGVAFSGLTSGPYIVGLGFYPTATGVFNFGQRPFAYTAPSGFRALNTQNLPTPTIGATTATQAGKFFNPVLWTANGGVQTITGAGLQPDFLWIKDRQAANSHTLHNIVVGSTKYLESNTTSAEITSANYVTSIDSDGWSIGTSNYLSGRQLVSWCWKANGAGVTNTAGTVNSTVSANTTSGFSVALWTGTGVNATFGHGLGVAPAMVIMKNRTQGGVGYNWAVYHRSLPDASYFLDLNTSNAQAINAGIWNSVAPTATVVTVGTARINNGDLNVAYCFAEVPGYSRFGSYTGNGSTDGPFVFCGFRPAYVMVKTTGTPNDWAVFDVARNTFNSATGVLYPNLSNAEAFFPAGGGIDILSNGFKMRADGLANGNGNAYIFAAFASAPQKFALAR